MTRKKWTAKENVTDADLKFREKRKWQQALRRYVLEKNVSEGYAMYFGLSIYDFRQWVEIQFTDGMNWENFASVWQFEHIVPIAYFDFNIENDLRLAWSFINIRVEKIETEKGRGNRINVIAVKTYFKALFDKTKYSICAKMLNKIDQIEQVNMVSESSIEQFIISRKEDLELLSILNPGEFAKLNKGSSLADILLEKEILRKFG